MSCSWIGKRISSRTGFSSTLPCMVPASSSSHGGTPRPGAGPRRAGHADTAGPGDDEALPVEHPDLDVVMVTGVVDAETAVNAIRDGASGARSSCRPRCRLLLGSGHGHGHGGAAGLDRHRHARSRCHDHAGAAATHGMLTGTGQAQA